MKIKIKVGDVVEVHYPHNSTWDGIQFRVTEHNQFMSKGIIVKTTPYLDKSRPVGNKFTWSCSKGLIVVKSSTKIKVGDVVEARYPETHHKFDWDGFRFQVTKCESNNVLWGRVIKTVPTHEKILPVGQEFIWGVLSEETLVIVNSKNEPKNEQPTENQVYIDHIYERLTQKVTPEELIGLAEKIIIFANKQL